MDTLHEKLKQYSLEGIIKLEESDRQFLALKSLFKNKSFSDENFLFLAIANALICYQLSGKGEEYWEEFNKALQNRKVDDFAGIKIFFDDFLPISRNNKRLLNMKLPRVSKLEKFYTEFTEQSEMYYKNMDRLSQNLARVMSQKKSDKTIVFAVKMFGYACRNVFDYIEYFPKNLMLPLDSRLEKVYYKYNPGIENPNKKDIEKFYVELADKLNIPPLHLDAVLWINFNDIMKE